MNEPGHNRDTASSLKHAYPTPPAGSTHPYTSIGTDEWPPPGCPGPLGNANDVMRGTADARSRHAFAANGDSGSRRPPTGPGTRGTSGKGRGKFPGKCSQTDSTDDTAVSPNRTLSGYSSVAAHLEPNAPLPQPNHDRRAQRCHRPHPAVPRHCVPPAGGRPRNNPYRHLKEANPPPGKPATERRTL